MVSGSTQSCHAVTKCTSHLNRFPIIDRDNGGVSYGARITPNQEKINLENLGECEWGSVMR